MDVSVFLEPIDLTRLAEILDGLGHEGRVHAIRTWTKHHQAELFEAAKGKRPLDLDFLVPANTGALVEVIHDGQNSRPIFHHFQKRFVKLENEDFAIGGYNHQAMSAATGPGYFVVRKGDGEHEGELAIDYAKLPKHKPASWPAIKSNTGLRSFLYGGTVDYLRGISQHVSIGRAYRGKAMDTWFALVRKN
ncbi:MAG: hypothetical protein FWD69_11570 [Polyangiaceae bacterium]|nr:hypothetical protein [Polyangiaceae bacterium]